MEVKDSNGEEMEEKTLTPFVVWAQRKDMILLRVSLRPLEKPDFNVTESRLSFKCLAVGASGKNQYEFELIFCEAINSEQCRVRFFENEIEFRLLKKQSGSWPRLQSSHQRPHWLKPDFDRWEVSESEEEDENTEMSKEEKMKELMRNNPELRKAEEMIKQSMETYEKTLAVIEYTKKGYLVLYNTLQWFGFMIVVGSLFGLAVKQGYGSNYDGSVSSIFAGTETAYERVSHTLMLCQMLAILEVVNAALGLVKGGVFPAFMQVGGRFFILFVSLAPVEAIHHHPVVFVLFLAWSLVELFRYPYYALSVLDVDIPILTWLRYSVWIPLYPVGFTCEATVIWLSLQNAPPGGIWSYPLPNPLNISISVASIQWIALVLVPLIAYQLISHMFVQRKRKLNVSRKKKKN